jgi:ATPase family associated with various cellular activities (AAA)
MLPWLDLLFTDDWNSALLKTAQRTAEAYPEFKIDAEVCKHILSRSERGQRWWSRHYARRTRCDPDSLDLAWLMLAADPDNAGVTYGFIGRLGDRVTDWQVNNGGLWNAFPPYEVVRRLERWEQVHDGFKPVMGADPFKVTSDALWGRAMTMLADAKGAASAAEQPPVTLRDRLTPPNAVPDDVPTIQVMRPVGKTPPPYTALANEPTPLSVTPAVGPVAAALRAEFPHAAAAIETMLVDLQEGDVLSFRPFILVGEPGCGKSRMIRRLAEHLGAKLRRYDGAASTDNTFGGTPKRWAQTSSCFPLIAIAELKVGNPIVMVDEVDKAAIGYYAGNLALALIPFLEKETSRAYPDVSLEVECNLSAVCYAMTANDVTKLPSPLRDRCRIVKVPSPGVEHLAGLVSSIMRDLAVDRRLDPGWLAPLAGDEMDVVAKAWTGSDRSVRKLQKIVSATVTARDYCAPRH